MKIIDILNKMADETLLEGFEFVFEEEYYRYSKTSVKGSDGKCCKACLNKYGKELGESWILAYHLNDEVKLFEED